MLLTAVDYFLGNVFRGQTCTSEEATDFNGLQVIAEQYVIGLQLFIIKT